MKKRMKLTFTVNQVMDALTAMYPDACTGTDPKLWLCLRGVPEPKFSGDDECIILEVTPDESKEKK